MASTSTFYAPQPYKTHLVLNAGWDAGLLSIFHLAATARDIIRALQHFARRAPRRRAHARGSLLLFERLFADLLHSACGRRALLPSWFFMSGRLRGWVFALPAPSMPLRHVPFLALLHYIAGPPGGSYPAVPGCLSAGGSGRVRFAGRTGQSRATVWVSLTLAHMACWLLCGEDVPLRGAFLHVSLFLRYPVLPFLSYRCCVNAADGDGRVGNATSPFAFLLTWRIASARAPGSYRLPGYLGSPPHLSPWATAAAATCALPRPSPSLLAVHGHGCFVVYHYGGFTAFRRLFGSPAARCCGAQRGALRRHVCTARTALTRRCGQ